MIEFYSLPVENEEIAIVQTPEDSALHAGGLGWDMVTAQDLVRSEGQMRYKRAHRFAQAHCPCLWVKTRSTVLALTAVPANLVCGWQLSLACTPCSSSSPSTISTLELGTRTCPTAVSSQVLRQALCAHACALMLW